MLSYKAVRGMFLLFCRVESFQHFSSYILGGAWYRLLGYRFASSLQAQEAPSGLGRPMGSIFYALPRYRDVWGVVAVR